MTDGITPSQTVGPFFAYCLTPEDYEFRPMFSADLTRPDLAGERIRIEGRVTDGDGAPVPDAVIEIWQADAEGRYAHPADSRPKANTGFIGFGRSPTDADGAYRFATVKPGPVPGPGGAMQAPHINVTVLARGLLTHQITRLYFPDEASTAHDPVLALVPDDAGRETLIARKVAGGGETTYRFDIRLQGDANGEGETVFFEC